MKLKPEVYWEWRCTINEMDLAKKDLDVNTLKYEMMVKDQEISRLRSLIFKNSLSHYQDKQILTKNEYEKMKKRIEEDLGMSLNNTVIDDITHEVKKLEI